MSADGSTMAVLVAGSKVWSSSDSGATWIEDAVGIRLGGSTPFRAISMSADAAHAVASNRAGDFYFTRNGTLATPAPVPVPVASEDTIYIIEGISNTVFGLIIGVSGIAGIFIGICMCYLSRPSKGTLPVLPSL